MVDDDPRVLAAVSRAMARICEVFPCPTAEVALHTADELGPHLDCAAVDINLGRGPDGIEVLESLRRRRPGLPALVFTGEWTIDACIWERYAALRPAPWGLGDFRRLVELAPIVWLLGTTYSKEVAGAVHAESARLSPRERQVLALVVRGDTAECIARDLGIKVSSVETYFANLRGKLGLRGVREIRRTILERAARATPVDERTPSPPTREPGLALPLFPGRTLQKS